MANLKEIRTRISSVTSTRKITGAMKMVSAAKFKKAQNNLLRFRPFYEKINHLAADLIKSSVSNESAYMIEREQVRNIGVVLITSNNSMCGAFNANIIKRALVVLNELNRQYPQAKVIFYPLGKTGEEFMVKNKFNVVSCNNAIIEKPSVERTKDFFNLLNSLYLGNELDRIVLVYNSFKNAATQIQKVETLLPLVTPDEQYGSEDLRIVEPDPATLLDRLLPYYLLNSLHSSILESSAAEHGARMTAMHQATENATTIMNNLILEYNKARQASITNEILEIVSGANALSH